jgi:hypothetical protein
MTHIDDWIDSPVFGDDKQSQQEAYAKFVLIHMRMPAWMKMAFRKWTTAFKLFCDYEGKRYRVTGASRLGDVWLAEDFSRSNGYDKRVDVAACSNWGDAP